MAPPVSCSSPTSLSPHLAHSLRCRLPTTERKAVKTRRNSDFIVESPSTYSWCGRAERADLNDWKILHVASKLPFGDVPSPTPSNYTLQPPSTTSMAIDKCSPTIASTDKYAHLHLMLSLMRTSAILTLARAASTLRHHARLDPEAEAHGWGDS